MENQNANGQPAGDAGAASPGAPDSGGQGGDAGSQGTPQDQSGASPDPKDEQIKSLQTEIRGLNKAVIDAKRANRQGNPPAGNADENPLNTEAGQYAAALELSDARLRGNIEERIALYPELPADEVQRIRLNPWAFASRQSFLTGDWETALDEVEEKIANRVEELASSTQPQGQPQGGASAPANVNANPAPEGEAEEAMPGSDQDENLWTMPLGKLERLKDKAVAKMSQKQQ